MAKEMTKEEIANLIDRHLDGLDGTYEWDDFESIPFKDPELDAIRRECLEIERKYPPANQYASFSHAGVSELRRVAAELRQPKGDAG